MGAKWATWEKSYRVEGRRWVRGYVEYMCPSFFVLSSFRCILTHTFHIRMYIHAHIHAYVHYEKIYLDISQPPSTHFQSPAHISTSLNTFTSLLYILLWKKKNFQEINSYIYVYMLSYAVTRSISIFWKCFYALKKKLLGERKTFFCEF